jgi:hypothetical protein
MFAQVRWRSFPFRFFRNMALLRFASTFSKKRQGLPMALINLNGLHLESGTTALPVQDQALFFEVRA